MSYRQLRGLYNTAALSGGVTMEDVAANADQLDFEPMEDIAVPAEPVEESGGWDLSLGFDPNADGLAALMAEIAGKYNLNPDVVERYAGNIYRYDTALANNDAQTAYNLKANTILTSPIRRKFWNYLRNRIHMGDSRPPKMTKAARRQRAQAAALARTNRQQALARVNFPWYGSNPYNQQGKRSGNYRGLAYWRPRNRTPAAQVYANLPVPAVRMAVPPPQRPAIPPPPTSSSAMD